jgi:hypothetical protein
MEPVFHPFFFSVPGYSLILLYTKCHYKGFYLYFRALCNALNHHRPLPFPCVGTVLPHLEVTSPLHSRLTHCFCSLPWASDEEDFRCCGCSWVRGPVDDFHTSWVVFSSGLTVLHSGSGNLMSSVFSILEAAQMK